MIKVGIIGTGIGGLHASSFKKCPDVEIKAICDIDADLTLQHPNVSGHEMEIFHFVECIRENKSPIAVGEHGLHIQLILDAIYESTETGKGVEIA